MLTVLPSPVFPTSPQFMLHKPLWAMANIKRTITLQIVIIILLHVNFTDNRFFNGQPTCCVFI